jgi:hypothetical protein
VEQNLEAAKQFYKMAADNNYVDAQINLANLYYQISKKESGELFPILSIFDNNLEQAVKYYQMATNNGNPIAQFNLGYFYYKGYSVEQNLEVAKNLYTLAANQGHIKAQLNLANLLYRESAKSGATEFVDRYQMAANQGHIKAQYVLGVLYQKGEDVEKDEMTSLHWFGQFLSNKIEETGKYRVLAKEFMNKILLSYQPSSQNNGKNGLYFQKPDKDFIQNSNALDGINPNDFGQTIYDFASSLSVGNFKDNLNKLRNDEKRHIKFLFDEFSVAGDKKNIFFYNFIAIDKIISAAQQLPVEEFSEIKNILEQSTDLESSYRQLVHFEEQAKPQAKTQKTEELEGNFLGLQFGSQQINLSWSATTPTPKRQRAEEQEIESQPPAKRQTMEGLGAFQQQTNVPEVFLETPAPQITPSFNSTIKINEGQQQ